MTPPTEAPATLEEPASVINGRNRLNDLEQLSTLAGVGQFGLAVLARSACG